MTFSILKLSFVSTTTLALMTVSSWAAVPKISGNYALNFTEMCQAVEGGTTGFINNYLVVGDFNDTNMTVQITGTKTAGALVVWNGGTAGLVQSPDSGSTSYSNTATTITVDGTIYNVVYGPSKKGVAQSAQWSGIGPDGAGCLETGTAIIQ